jgi:hypothetical protein
MPAKDRTVRLQIAALALCGVAGIVIISWMIAQRQTRGGKRIVIDKSARPATVATTRAAVTRPAKMELLAAMHVNLPGPMEAAKVKKLLIDDPGLAKIEDERFGYATPLHFASWEGNQDLAQLLLDDGANLEAREVAHDGTPLEWAVYAGQVEMVRFLLSKGAKVDDNALHVAVMGTQRRAYLTTQPAKYKEIQKMLLEKVKRKWQGDKVIR